MPIIDGITYIDNTYARDVATCSTKAYIERVLGYQPINRNLDAAHVGNAIHAGMEAYFNAGNAEEALAAFGEKYDELLPPTEASQWDSWQPRRTTKAESDENLS